MYSIYCDNTLLYKDTSMAPQLKVVDAVLTVKENAAGSLEFTVPPMNQGYDEIEKMRSTIHVYRDGAEYWRGRVLTEASDFLNQKKLTCEGAFAFFNDIQIPPYSFNGRIEDAIPELLAIYNQNVPQSRRILNGTCTVDNGIEIETEEYTSMYDILKTYFIDQYNGCFKIRFENGNAYLDYIETEGDGTQSITFGENLLDFTKSFDMTDIITVLIPLGPEDEETGERMTIEDVGTDGIYYEMPNMISRYGRIEQVQIFDDAEDEYDLLAKAEEYMTAVQYEELVLEVSAVDLHYLDNTVSRFDLYQNIHCISKPHGLDNWYPVCEMHLDLTRPENCKYVLGPSKEKRISGKINKIVNDAVASKVPAEVQHQMSKLNWPEIAVDIVDKDVIKAETMEATFAYFRYMLVQFLETNFDAIDARHSRTNTYRRYIKIYNEIIAIYEDVLGDTVTNYTDPENNQLYWTAIDGDNAYKYFTYQSPKTISPDKRPSGITDEEFEDMYKVKVYAALASTLKATIGYSNYDQSQTLEPSIILGAGDGNGYGKSIIEKSIDGVTWLYSTRTTNINLGFKIQDDGTYYTQDGTNWFLVGSGSTGGNVKIIDHAPIEADLTGENTVFARYDPQDTPVLSGAIGVLFNALNVYIEQPAIAAVTISPSSVTVRQGQTQQFTASVASAWTVTGNTSGSTSIDANGLLTVGSDEEGTLFVTARSTVDTNKYASAEVSVISAEEGREYLFKHGDVTAVTGGWGQSYNVAEYGGSAAYSVGSTITITILGFAGTHLPTNNLIDFTNYSKMCVSVEMVPSSQASSQPPIFVFGVTDVPPGQNNGGSVVINVIATQGSGLYEIDLRNVNGQHRAFVGASHGAIASFSQIWLE